MRSISPQSFSPSAMEDWLRCPMRWWLRSQQGWRSRSESLSARQMGTLFHAVMARLVTRGETVEQALAAAERDSVEGLLGEGRAPFLKAITRAHKLVPPGEVRLAELAMGQGKGSARMDLLVTRDGEHHIIDFKWTGKLDARWADRRLLEFNHSVQLWEYAYRAEAMLGITVATVGVILATAEPTPKAWEWTVPVDREHLTTWRRDRQEVLDGMRRMAAGTRDVFGNWTACGDFGGCPYMDACHHLGRDPERMTGLYTREGHA